jgi:hypothetical protein
VSCPLQFSAASLALLLLASCQSSPPTHVANSSTQSPACCSTCCAPQATRTAASPTLADRADLKAILLAAQSRLAVDRADARAADSRLTRKRIAELHAQGDASDLELSKAELDERLAELDLEQARLAHQLRLLESNERTAPLTPASIPVSAP